MRAIEILLWIAAVVLTGLLAVSLSLEEVALEQWDGMGSAQMYWYMGRASGFVAYGLLFASVVLGLAISSRVFDGVLARPWVFDTHQFLSLFVLIAMLFHVLILLPDPYWEFKPEQLLIPFKSPYRAFAVGLGAIVLYGSAIVSISFYLKRIIGQWGWRALHYLTFALFVGAMVHGLLAGTDSGESWAQPVYLSSGFAVLFLTFFRILVSRRIAREERDAQALAGEPVTAGR